MIEKGTTFKMARTTIFLDDDLKAAMDALPVRINLSLIANERLKQEIDTLNRYGVEKFEKGPVKSPWRKDRNLLREHLGIRILDDAKGRPLRFSKPPLSAKELAELVGWDARATKRLLDQMYNKDPFYFGEDLELAKTRTIRQGIRQEWHYYLEPVKEGGERAA